MNIIGHFIQFTCRPLLNLPTAAVENSHILQSGVFWDPSAIYDLVTGNRQSVQRVYFSDWTLCWWGLEKFNFFPISTIFSHLVTGWVKILSFARLQFKKKINTSLPGPKRPQKAVGRLTLQHIVSFEWDTCNECYTGHCRCRIITEGFLEGNTLDTVKTRNMSQNLLGEIVLR